MRRGMADARRAWMIPLVLLLAGGLALQLRVFWPGIMIYDASRQYDEALTGRYDDWHPPAMDWLWHILLPLGRGPIPMLIVQGALYWGGYALLAGWAWRARRPRLAVGLALAAFLPIPFALFGAVLKDCLMAGILLVAVGLLAWDRQAGRRRGPAIVAGALIVASATLRFNAFLAGLPLLVALLPLRWRDTPLRLAVATALAAVPLVVAMPIANRLLQAENTGVELSLMIFDMGGITEGSGVDVFPAVGVADPVAVNHRCYAPNKWDTYAWWVDELCPIDFYGIQKAFAASGESATGHWLRAIAAHPIAYAAHRLRHFNINSRFLVRDPIVLRGHVERPVFDQSDPNDWGYRIGNGVAQRTIDAIALASARLPIGWPIWWMAVAAGVLVLTPRLPSRGLIGPVGLSALLYGLGYLPLSVASDMRYHVWTMTAALIAAVLAASEWRGLRLERWRIATAAAPLTIVTVAGAAYRLMG